MAMNVPTWANAGVSPSAEKKAEGYAAGEFLLAQHLNWFLNQTFSNLSEVKSFIDSFNGNMPFRVIYGTYIGTGKSTENITADKITDEMLEEYKIDIGVTPIAVLFGSMNYGHNESLLMIKGQTYTTSNNLQPNKIMTNGFTVNARGSSMNYAGLTYHYLAFVEC